MPGTQISRPGLEIPASCFRLLISTQNNSRFDSSSDLTGYLP